jgi:pyruvate formate lyase activating enzyme
MYPKMIESPKKILNLRFIMEITAKYQRKGPESKVQCILCPHNCHLEDGQRGICRVRINMHGELISIAYGNPCSISIDPIEKKPLYHFLPGTDIFSLAIEGCNLKCLNCQNWTISQAIPDTKEQYILFPEEVISEAVKKRSQSIAFTYSEPTVFYEYMLDTFRIAKEKGLRTVAVSNGFINPEPLIELCNWLDAANIDLKCFDDSLSKKLTGGAMKPVLKTLGILRDKGIWLEITNLIVPGWSDDMQTIKRMCEWLYDNGFSDTPLHFSRFFPNYKLTNLHPTPEKTMIEARNTAHRCGLKYVYLGNIYVPACGDTICPNCHATVVKREGYIVRNFITNEGTCPKCGQKIPGIWK